MSKNLYCFIDLETTGLDPKVDQVTEIAAVKTDGERILGTYHTYVQLYKMDEVPEFVRNLTGIDKELLNFAGIHHCNAFLGLTDFLYGHRYFDAPIVVAQFAPFDLSFLSVQGIYPKEFICTRYLSKALDPTLSASLKDVYQRLFNEPLKGHHSALQDALATMRVFNVQKKRADEAGIEYMNIVNNSSDRPLNFVPKYAKVVTI